MKHLDFDKKENFSMKIIAHTMLEDVHLGISIFVYEIYLTATGFDTALFEFNHRRELVKGPEGSSPREF